jgi:hypothetical protein
LQVKDFLTNEEEFRRLKEEEAIKDGIVREDRYFFWGDKGDGKRVLSLLSATS